jgi:EAL domain-containing protein (putative c-di-GMP-specific phosphodiesterase class I)
LSRSIGLAHIIRQNDRTSTGVWGAYTLKSAFQPIFSFIEGRLELTAFEGLIRAFRGTEGVSPGAFFGSVPPGDRLHVETLTRTLHLLNASACLDPRASLFVNFDPSLFVEPAVAQAALRDMRLVLHEAGIEPGRIVCEVTEQRTASEVALHAFVRALRDHGFRIAIDDYGAEESGIQRINQLHPDIVKFDAHWISRLMSTGPGSALLEAMVAEFHKRGILSLFEGLEEPWQLEIAERCNVDMVQGYVLARPEIAPTSFGVFARRAAPAMAKSGKEAEAPAPPAREPEEPAPRRGGLRRPTFGHRGIR